MLYICTVFSTHAEATCTVPMNGNSSVYIAIGQTLNVILLHARTEGYAVSWENAVAAVMLHLSLKQASQKRRLHIIQRRMR